MKGVRMWACVPLMLLGALLLTVAFALICAGDWVAGQRVSRDMLS